MLKKLRLDQTKIYEQTIATYEIAKMVVDFVKGRKHYLSIGAEQGDVDTWDDLIIEKEKNCCIHIQVKRQNTDFSTDNCIRDTYIRGPREGKLRDLSAIDESMKALAKWTKDPKNDLSKKEFHIELPTYEVKLKNGLTVRNFKEFIQSNYRKNITTTQGLADLAKKDPNIEKCYQWLTTWCEFKDWDHILKMLSVIKIEDSGAEENIESKTEDILREVFITDKVTEVRIKILSYIHINTTFTGTISPRCLLLELMGYLQPNLTYWTQFEKQNDNWCISGINDIESNTEIERPSQIIPKLWNGELPQNLKINATLNDQCKVSDSLIRLTIHQTGNSNTHCVNREVIIDKIKAKTGGTLGIEKNDLQTLSVIENTEQFRCEEIKKLTYRAENEAFSEEMENYMNLQTWEKVSKNIEDKIDEMGNNHILTLRDSVETRWNNWKGILKKEPKEFQELFKSMVHPNAEGDDIKEKFRIGVRTAELLSDGIFLLLITSVCLDPDNKGNWTKISDKLTLVTIGLRFWSGAAGSQRRVRQIDEDGDKIIGREQANGLIFSQVQVLPSEMLGDLISDSKEKGVNSLADGKIPDLIITNNLQLRKLINNGDLEATRVYLNKQLRSSDKINQTEIKEILE
jgi:hypothetical protein